jgi:class 3 adenylate cyclase/tetratricopeptide (TPR) repeat protein/type II secretory pathway predicted ATPase ExeA
MDSDALGPLETAPAEERKVATVLFADLVGSTELGGSQDPERTRLLLERFYDAMAAEIAHGGGTPEKFVGDAVMAAFGVPAAQEDHAERALHTALSMKRRLTEVFGDRLAIRIGVNTGEVVLGRAREGGSFVTGDAVNVAARLEQAAEPGEVLVGERTVSAARGAFEFAEPAAVEAKGKPEPVSCRRLVRALSLMRPRGIGGLAAAFVGREAELALLQDAYQAVVEQGSPRLVTVLGEAGVGKTRLARELWQWLAAQTPEPVRRTGRCLSYGQGITYWPLGEILKEQLGLLEDDRADAVLEALGARRILGLTLGLDVGSELHPLAARDRLHDAWVELLDELVAERPAVILIEDLHWAEDELLDLLERLIEDTSGPMLLLCTARPDLLDLRPGWGGARRAATTLELEPLPAEEVERMLEALLDTELPSQFRDVFGRAEGNPFFLEELLATLIDQGLLACENGGWTGRSLPADFSVPDSVQAVLAARIDLLSSPEKTALQAASVVGRVFWTGPVYELLADTEPDFRVLEERDFIRRRPGSSIAGEREFAFKHQLTREVAYASLPKARRARLHAWFAGWLERFGEGRDEHASLLAHHYAEAVRPEDADLAWADSQEELERLRLAAVGWLRRAAELATGRYELRDALSLLDRALGLAQDDEVKIGILREAAETHLLAFDPERFRAAMEQALALEPERGVAAEIFAELALYGRGRAYMWKQPPPAEVSEHWLETALELAPPKSHARASALLAHALATPASGADTVAEAHAIAEELRDPALLVDVYEARAHVASASQRFQEGCRWAERALEAEKRLSDPGFGFHQHWLAGFFFLRAGRIADVYGLAHECDRLASKMTDHDEVHAVALRGLLDSSIGRWQQLAELTGRAERGAEANDDTPCQFNWRSLLVCALGLAHLGEEDEARRLEERACARAVVYGPLEREPALLRLALLRGDLDEAERILERLPTIDPWGLDGPAARLDALVALGDRMGVEDAAAPFVREESYYRPFALRALGLVRTERALVEQALARFEAMGLEWHADQTRLLL